MLLDSSVHSMLVLLMDAIKTFKQLKIKYAELLNYYTRSQEAIALKSDLLAQSLNGQIEFLFNCSQFDTNETTMVYRAAKGQIVTVDTQSRPGAPSINVFRSLTEMSTFYATLSGLPHNEEMRSKIAIAMKSGKVAA